VLACADVFFSNGKRAVASLASESPVSPPSRPSPSSSSSSSSSQEPAARSDGVSPGADSSVGARGGVSAAPFRQSPDAPVLEARGLEKTYAMGEVLVHALRGVDLAFRKGELVVLLGPSGSGKSTLLNILGGLDAPTKGQVFFRGEDLTRAGERELTRYRRTHVGFVFQFYNLIPSLTARENVELVTEIADAPMSPDEALARVGLFERRTHFPAQLSGGEQQRVAIARAIAKRPAILLCDEPTGALDHRTGKVVLEVIDRVNRELGTTTVVITHNAAIAAMADRVVTFADGNIASVHENGERRPISEVSW
jgi:putative ABC transport system ATP-binding protein